MGMVKVGQECELWLCGLPKTYSHVCQPRPDGVERHGARSESEFMMWLTHLQAGVVEVRKVKAVEVIR